MNKVQKFFKAILSSEKYQRIEEESKKWLIECPKCGYKISVWEAGGVRSGASSVGKRTLGRCPQCKRWSFMKVRKAS